MIDRTPNYGPFTLRLLHSGTEGTLYELVFGDMQGESELERFIRHPKFGSRKHRTEIVEFLRLMADELGFEEEHFHTDGYQQPVVCFNKRRNGKSRPRLFVIWHAREDDLLRDILIVGGGCTKDSGLPLRDIGPCDASLSRVQYAWSQLKKDLAQERLRLSNDGRQLTGKIVDNQDV